MTIIPSVLFALGMTFDLMSARVLGMMGLVLNYQMLYGGCTAIFLKLIT